MFQKVTIVPELVNPILGADIYDMKFITKRDKGVGSFWGSMIFTVKNVWAIPLTYMIDETMVKTLRNIIK